jgi:hypothetical protein
MRRRPAAIIEPGMRRRPHHQRHPIWKGGRVGAYPDASGESDASTAFDDAEHAGGTDRKVRDRKISRLCRRIPGLIHVRVRIPTARGVEIEFRRVRPGDRTDARNSEAKFLDYGLRGSAEGPVQAAIPIGRVPIPKLRFIPRTARRNL